MTDTPASTIAPDELVLEPPNPVRATTPDAAASTIRVDDETASRISATVTAFVDSLMNLDAQSPELERKVRSISRTLSEASAKSRSIGLIRAVGESCASIVMEVGEGSAN